jgi:heterodisulfide reductase subunit C
MDFAPYQIFHMLRLGFPDLEEKVLQSESIWLCLSCSMCSTRCPQEVDIPKIMDALRSESLRRNRVNPKCRDIVSFHRAFLDAVRHAGRQNEVDLVAGYKMRSGHFLKDLLLAPRMFLKGKLGLKLHRVHDRTGVRALFRRKPGKG